MTSPQYGKGRYDVGNPVNFPVLEAEIPPTSLHERLGPSMPDTPGNPYRPVGQEEMRS